MAIWTFRHQRGRFALTPHHTVTGRESGLFSTAFGRSKHLRTFGNSQRSSAAHPGSPESNGNIVSGSQRRISSDLNERWQPSDKETNGPYEEPYEEPERWRRRRPSSPQLRAASCSRSTSSWSWMSELFRSRRKKTGAENLHRRRSAVEEICQLWQFLPGAPQTLRLMSNI